MVTSNIYPKYTKKFSSRKEKNEFSRPSPPKIPSITQIESCIVLQAVFSKIHCYSRNSILWILNDLFALTSTWRAINIF